MTKKKPEKNYCEGELAAMLHRKFHHGNGHVFFEQVRSHTGFSDNRKRTRTLDGMAIAFWPSLGGEVQGFEIKVSRADFQRELKDMSKSEEFSRYCDKFWIVVPNSKVARPDDMPKSWGLMHVRGGALTVVKQAVANTSIDPMGMPLLLSLVASMSKSQDAAIRSARVQAKQEIEAEYERKIWHQWSDNDNPDSEAMIATASIRAEIDLSGNGDGVLVRLSHAQIDAISTALRTSGNYSALTLAMHEIARERPPQRTPSGEYDSDA